MKSTSRNLVKSKKIAKNGITKIKSSFLTLIIKEIFN